MREYDLLVGILACQLRLVSRGTLVRYSALFAESSSSSLLDFLLEAKALTESDQQFLCRIVDTIVHAYRGDERAALNAFGGEDAASDAFARSIIRTDNGWAPSEDYTILAEQLPHGLPAQITPETIGRYTQGSEYARGGIGRILLVHDEQLGRDVILKELLPEHTSSPTASTLSQIPRGDSPKSPMRKSASMMARFLQEAKITGQLEHPSIVPVYELGTRKDGQLYYTMKLVRGDTLSVAIKNCKKTQDRLGLLRSFLDVCQAMAYAHSKGVIHRDLKPSNIMVGEFGECVVLDWGLAKMQRDVDAHREALENTISQLKLGDEPMAGIETRSKDILGTPLYMSPEQARGEVDAVGFHSDVYSLGVILFEILSGELPHPWSNTLDTIRRVSAIPAPSVRNSAPHTPPELAAICDKALSFDARRRYTNARELATDVQHFLEGAVVAAYDYSLFDRLARAYRRHKVLIRATVAASTIVLMVGALSFVNIYMAHEAELEARIVAEQQREVAEQQREAAETQRRAANAARLEAESSLKRALRQQYLSQIHLAQSHIANQQMRLANEALATAPTAERDWVWHYLFNEANSDLFTVRSEKSTIHFAIYDPKGAYIAAVRSNEAPALWKADDGTFIRDFEGKTHHYNSVGFSDDGSRFAAIGDGGVLDVWEVETGVRLRRFAYLTEGISVVFSSGGTRLWASYDGGALVEWSMDTDEPLRTVETGCTAGEILFPPYDNVLLSLCGSGLDEGNSKAIVARDVTTGETLYELSGTGVWPAPDRKTFLCATWAELTDLEVGGSSPRQSRLALYKTSDGGLVQSFAAYDKPILHASFAADEQHFVSASLDRTIRVWSLNQESYIHEFHTESLPINVFLPGSGMDVLVCTNQNEYEVWDASHNEQLVTFVGEAPFLVQASLSPDHTRLLATPGFNTFEVFDPVRPRGYTSHANVIEPPPPLNRRVEGFVVAPHEGHAAIDLSRKLISVLDLSSLELLATFPLDGSTPPRTEITGDGSRVLYCSGQGNVELGTVGDGAVTRLTASRDLILSLALSETGRHAAWFTQSSELHVRDFESDSVLLKPQLDFSSRAMAFDSAGNQLVLGCDDGNIRVLDIAAGVFHIANRAHEGAIADIALHPTKPLAATVAANGAVVVSDFEQGVIVYRLGIDESAWNLPEAGLSVRIAKDGRFLFIHFGLITK